MSLSRNFFDRDDVKRGGPTLLQEALPLAQSTRQKGGAGTSASLTPADTLIVFDWDDTFFPTSGLERSRLLNFPAPRLRPHVEAQLEALAAKCREVLDYATQFGTVIIITNSAPGWIDTSCTAYMPSLHSKIKSFPIFAKPLSSPITFKNGAFRKECMNYSNCVSVGDGMAERTAVRKLMMERHGKNRYCKNLKFKDLPTVQQLMDQLDLVMQRLDHVVNHDGHLDLRVNVETRNPGVGGRMQEPGFAMKGSKTCWLSHMTHYKEEGGYLLPEYPGSSSTYEDLQSPIALPGISAGYGATVKTNMRLGGAARSLSVARPLRA